MQCSPGLFMPEFKTPEPSKILGSETILESCVTTVT